MNNNKDQKVIEGGYTLWARQTINSEIFFSKPPEWFKIWFYIVSKVYYKKLGKWDRGSRFFIPLDIARDTRTTENQVKKCLVFLRKSGMISTRRSTRGINLEILNFNHFQTAKNYKFSEESTSAGTREELERNQRGTTIEKNIIKKEKKNYAKEINSYLTSGKINIESWEDWVDYRGKMKPSTIVFQLRRLVKWSLSYQKIVIEHSIEKGYIGLYEPNGKDKVIKTDSISKLTKEEIIKANQ